MSENGDYNKEKAAIFENTGYREGSSGFEHQNYKNGDDHGIYQGFYNRGYERGRNTLIYAVQVLLYREPQTVINLVNEMIEKTVK